MFTVTNKAVALLKATKSKEGMPSGAGIRILKGANPSFNGVISVGLSITDDPMPSDESFEQDGLRIFVEDTLIGPLEDRILDVREGDEGPELVLR